MSSVRALLDLMAALRGTVGVALARARPRTLVVGAGVGLVALVLGAVQFVGDGRDGPPGGRGPAGDVAAGAGQVPSPGDAPVLDGEGRPLVAGLGAAPVAPRSDGTAAAGAAGPDDGPGPGPGAGDMVGSDTSGPGGTEPTPGSGAVGGTGAPSTTAAPGVTATTTGPGTTATTAAPDPGGGGGGLQALLALLGLG